MSLAPPPVRLRVPDPEDAAAWHRVFDDPEVMEFLGGTAMDLAHYRDLVDRQRTHAAERGFCFYSVLDEHDAVVGFAGAQPWPHDDWGPSGEIEIGWRLGRAHWGHGYASAGALLTLERVRAAGVDHVVAMVDSRNDRSQAVARRLGMAQVRTYRSPVSRALALCYRLDL